MVALTPAWALAVAALTLTLTLPLAAAESSFVNCAVEKVFPAAMEGAKQGASMALAKLLTNCAAGGWKYAYHATQRYSWCSNYYIDQGPKRGAGWGASTASYTCPTSGLSFTVYIVDTDYAFTRCVSSPYFYPGPYTGSMFSTAKDAYYTVTIPGVTDAAACMDACAARYGKYGVFQSLAPESPCICAANYQGTQSVCTYTSYTVMTYSGVIPSGLPGARRRAMAERAAEADRALQCPRGYAACSVSRGSADYECLDTESELESCGGCLHGAHGNTTVAVGTDCTSIPGVDPRGTTCREHTCVVSRCRRGFVLDGGACRPVKAHSVRLSV